MLSVAASFDFDAVAISSGTLHRRVGGFPNGGNHRMPMCVRVMRAKMREDLGDHVLAEPQVEPELVCLSCISYRGDF